MEKTNRQSSDFEELWSKYYASHNSENEKFYRNKLITVYLPFLEDICESVHSRLLPFIELEDIKSYGVFGLIDAVEKYNRTEGSFQTYAKPKIIGSIKDELRKLDFVPRLVRLRTRQVDKATQKLEYELEFDRSLTNEELIKELSNDKIYPSIPDDKNRSCKFTGEEKARIILRDGEILKKLHYFGFNEIEDLEKTANNEKIKYLRSSNFRDPYVTAQKKDFRSFLEEGLTETQKEILHLRYFLYHRNLHHRDHSEERVGMSTTDLGKLFGKSPQNMWKRCKTILKILNLKLTTKGLTLEDCLEEL